MTFLFEPRNLDSIKPAFPNFRITSDLPGDIYSGLSIIFCIAAVTGIPMSSTNTASGKRITASREDAAYYTIPLDCIGQVVHALLIRARLATIFDFRSGYLGRLWRSGTESLVPSADQPGFSATSM
ncbi:hypothetical protein [Methylocaldum szegediense]|uniref:Uncharacterized protein n=1 Tax=Methylocaldum szegediense TaxID=73780 RepID=A0ABN8WZU2_9GAMM|nr:hypothetical protein [Methylocaldum szegediense]CAI8782661.1 conserved protein of unknown function [Methylocaldum szegediense]